MLKDYEGHWRKDYRFLSQSYLFDGRFLKQHISFTYRYSLHCSQMFFFGLILVSFLPVFFTTTVNKLTSVKHYTVLWIHSPFYVQYLPTVQNMYTALQYFHEVFIWLMVKVMQNFLFEKIQHATEEVQRFCQRSLLSLNQMSEECPHPHTCIANIISHLESTEDSIRDK